MARNASRNAFSSNVKDGLVALTIRRSSSLLRLALGFCESMARSLEEIVASNSCDPYCAAHSQSLCRGEALRELNSIFGKASNISRSSFAPTGISMRSRSERTSRRSLEVRAAPAIEQGSLFLRCRKSSQLAAARTIAKNSLSEIIIESSFSLGEEIQGTKLSFLAKHESAPFCFTLW